MHIESRLVKTPRLSGVLLHPTSLPGRYGIGDLGSEAYRFAHYLASSGIKIWQVLPLGPTGYGDSPYQCFSAFAGNPMLISLEMLVEEGLLGQEDLANTPAFSPDSVDYGAVIDFKIPLLKRAYSNFKRAAGTKGWDEFQEFCSKNRHWLEDYALFRAVKDAHGGVTWTKWDGPIARFEPEAVEYWRERAADPIQMRRFWQFEFYKQWNLLRKFCSELGLQIMGDIPIFVAHDSADVWANRSQFQLDGEGHPTAVAGVPPDYFSATGQLWGNPLYKWEDMARNGYQWWVERFRTAFSQVDLIRLDHFRGFEAYWEVPGHETTAINGKWAKGPGAALFSAVEKALGELPLVAENLGWITPEVEQLRTQFEFPGMAILQFAFGTDPQASDFIPYNHTRDLVIYTGTHDNDTTVGWWNSTGEGDTRTPEQIESEKDLARRYLGVDGSQIHWDFIRAVMASVARIAMLPLQDVFGLGTEARMNLPGRPNGNWTWRFRGEWLTKDIQNRLLELTYLYGRRPRVMHKEETAAEE